MNNTVPRAKRGDQLPPYIGSIRESIESESGSGDGGLRQV